MSRPARMTATSSPAIFLPVAFVAGLIFYKWSGSLIVIQRVWSSGSLSLRTDIVALREVQNLAVAASTMNYFRVIWPALVFGILISAAVRTFIPREWIVRFFTRRKLRSQLRAGIAGAPLMLCSCCVAPVFSAVYKQSSCLGPSVAFMLASPSLNPAALVLTFMLFSAKVALARSMMAVAAVVLSGFLIDHCFSKVAMPVSIEGENRAASPSLKETVAEFFQSLWYVIIRTVPVLITGVIGSMLLVQYVPKELLASSSFRHMIVVATALIAVPLALPTFFEIPLALALISAGAPAGAAAALLFAGPAVNRPSLMTLAKSTNWKIAVTLAAFIWAIAVSGGLLFP